MTFPTQNQGNPDCGKAAARLHSSPQMQRHRFTFTLLAAMATLLARLAYSAAEVEQQATELERTSLLSAIGEGIILAVAIGFGAAILATFRKPTAKW